MLRTAHIDPVADRIRLVGVALASSALIAAMACGGKKQQSGGETVVSSTVPVTPPVKNRNDSSGTNVPSGTVATVNVPFSEAETAYKEKRYGDAVQMFAGYVERKPENAWGHYMLGLSSWKSGDLERAKAAFERALELDPQNVKSLLNLSRVLLDLGRPREARTRVTLALKADSSLSEGYRLLGRVRTVLKENDEAIEAYRIALVLEPTDVWSMNNMALLMIQQGKYDEALGPLARAVQLDSTVPVFQNNLGIALERTGHNELAAVAYRAALSADSTYQKASLSMTRLAGRKDDPGVQPIDLKTLAETFDREVRSTSIGSIVAKKPPTPPQW